MKEATNALFEIAKKDATQGLNYYCREIGESVAFTPQQRLELCKIRKAFYDTKVILASSHESSKPEVLLAELMVDKIDRQIRDLESTVAQEAVNINQVTAKPTESKKSVSVAHCASFSKQYTHVRIGNHTSQVPGVTGSACIFEVDMMADGYESVCTGIYAENNVIYVHLADGRIIEFSNYPFVLVKE